MVLRIDIGDPFVCDGWCLLRRRRLFSGIQLNQPVCSGYQRLLRIRFGFRGSEGFECWDKSRQKMSGYEVSDLHNCLSTTGDMLLTISFNMAFWVFHMNHFPARIFDLKTDGCFWGYIQTNIAIGNWCFENYIPFVVTWTVLPQLLTCNMSTWGGRMHGQLPDRVAWRHIIATSSWHPKYVL